MKSDLTAAEVRDAEQQVSFAAFAAWAIIGTNASPSDLQTMLRGAHRALVLAGEMLDCVAGDLEAVQMVTPSLAAKSATPHRHKFGEPKDGATPACTICGKLKAAGGRRLIAAAAPPLDTRTRPLPLGDAVADKYADGGQGSSGVRR
jgi:hypothetical protein